MAAVSASSIYQGRTHHVVNDPDFNKSVDSKPRFKSVAFTAPATADNTDTFYFDLRDYGMTRLMGITGNTHSTADSIIIEEAPTTAINGTVVTVTVGGSTANKKRFFVVYGV